MNIKDEDFLVEVEVETNMCECMEQQIITEVCHDCNKLRYRVNAELWPEHYGPYGENCMNRGQFDAGECWMCYARRKKQDCADMQLIASRNQYLFEHAQRFINKIDDLFEYPYLGFSLARLVKEVEKHLASYTDSVSKIKRREDAIPGTTKDSKESESREV